ncbi:hypothetical protein [Taibaiella helva]|uniref:hypothetical protein n=1 Tax=Taibaiella helva TaxID=2301235 RepID=UPI000E57D121|nr:hypothetical protein [Taibaiella helva]
MGKETYSVFYKVYFNERLKEVNLHGKATYPLYVQITFARKSIFFKSYYFELFSKSKYYLSVAGLQGGPTLEQITAKENELIDFIINKNLNSFSLDLFKDEYAYYSKDLCDVMEEGFLDYLYTFFQDKGMPTLAPVIREGSRFRLVYDVIQDLKRALAKPLYNEMIENSFYYAPPYLPLYEFMLQTKRWPMLSLSVMEWEAGDTKDKFADFLKKYYPKRNPAEVMLFIEKWLKS